MALTRRSTRAINASIWPGFVDAMTALLLVMMFVLTIFMVVQFVLREEISGQQSELNTLTEQVAGLTDALGLSEARVATLETEGAALRSEATRQGEVIENLREDGAVQAERIASFEDRVATLIGERDDARNRVAVLEENEVRLLSDQEALNLALAQAREEIDAGAEAARLAAARREALEALTAELRADLAAETAARTELAGDVGALETALDEEEAARVAEAAAAEALRERLENSDAELSAMTLALEEQRARAEETLTLLAAARSAEADLDERLAAALLTRDAASAEVQALEQDLAASSERNDALVETNQALRAAAEEGAAELDRTQALLQAALAEADAQTRELAAIADARDAAEAARTAFAGDLEEARAALAETEAQVAALREAAGREADERDRLAASLARARDEAAALEQAAEARSDLRDDLAEALRLQRSAEARAETQLSEAERQVALLATANAELSEAETANAAAERRLTALTEQVSRLRRDVASLQALLDVAEDRDAEREGEIENLGARLNAALVREAEEAQARAELEAAERERLERYQSEFFGRLRDLLGDREGIEVVGDRFVFDSEVLFPSGSADLSPAGRQQVARVAELLGNVSDDIPENIDWVIRVDGHTDDVPVLGTGAFDDNWELSQARALSVVRYMSEDLGFPAYRLAPTGFGQFRPVDERQTPEARARNRRIELKLTER